jgi:hypothetical protein
MLWILCRMGACIDTYREVVFQWTWDCASHSYPTSRVTSPFLWFGTLYCWGWLHSAPQNTSFILGLRSSGTSLVQESRGCLSPCAFLPNMRDRLCHPCKCWYSATFGNHDFDLQRIK